ncbi:MAG: hypothetical protein ABIH41_01790 [Nanoarchaeota archaeon]
MTIAHQVKTLEKSAIFKEFIAAQPSYYLTTVFVSFEGGKRQWQIGYYSSKTDKMVSFSTEPLAMSDEQEAFKDQGPIHPLELDHVKIELDEALGTCAAECKKKYLAHPITKQFIILQHLDSLVYNATFVTTTMNIINIKVDARDGTIVSSKVHPIIEFARPDGKDIK